jgi:molecular chaperone IbpA
MSLFDTFDRTTNALGSILNSNYPIYDLVKLSENEYKMDLALAGYLKDNLSVTVDNFVVTVTGTYEKKTGIEENEYPFFIKNGIAHRSFTKKFSIPENSEVVEAEFKDGILSILIRKNPADKKVSVVEIKHK